MTEECKSGFSYKWDQPLNSGLISRTIYDIHEEKGEAREKYLENILSSKKGQELKLVPDNIAIVYAEVTRELDGTLVSPDSYDEQYFILIREDAHSPWLIQSMGQGYGGI